MYVWLSLFTLEYDVLIPVSFLYVMLLVYPNTLGAPVPGDKLPGIVLGYIPKFCILYFSNIMFI